MTNLDEITEAKASQLLEFNDKLDINLLDSVIAIMYERTGPHQKMAEKVLNTLKEHPDAWTRVDCILEFSKSQNTKFYALQILESFIKTRWKILSRDQCDGIKKYVVGLIIQISSKPESLSTEKVYLRKLNSILIEILKHEWPHNWPSFINDIVGASNTNEYLCQNNMIILRLLSEEVFDFSSGALTQTKTRHLKDSMCKEFGIIFQLCQLILENSQSAELVSSTLETLLRFINWIPYGYIFETNLIAILIDKFLHLPLFRNVTIKCLTEIAGTAVPDFEDGCVQLLLATTKKISTILPLTVDIKSEYEKGSGEDQDFISNLAQFFCTFLKTYYELIMTPKLAEVFEQVYGYLLLISEVNEREIFKICLEYWNFLLSNLYDAKARHSFDDRFTLILSKLRKIMISRMARPEEVLVVENEHKEIVREFMKDTDSLNLYKNMKEALVYLTNLDQEDTRKIMLDKLAHQVDESEWSWNNLNTLCWAIGSISGTMPDDDERNFVVIVIRELLKLCENKRGKDNKAVIASNIMYVVGQYQRFLRAHWRFLKTVVVKLFEFMHETHEGIQDMACDTFIKIANKCRRQLATQQAGETCPFIEEILNDLPNIISDLQIGQLNTFYEAIGLIISIQTDSSIQRKQIESLFAYPNSIWDTLLVQASQDVNSLFNCDVQRQLQHLLKTNHACCKSLGHPFLVQLSRLYLDMLNIYKILSENINNAIKENGQDVVKQPVIKSMRLTKKAILNLISCWIKLTNQKQMVADTFVSVLLDGVAADYESNHPLAREPEVLSTMATLVESLESSILPHLPRILDTVFQSTLEMINKDLEEFPEHRTYFFELLQAVNEKCFGALLVLTVDKFKFILDSVIWAIKHTMRQISETGLKILSTMLSNMVKAPIDKHQMFFKNFFMDIMQHMFAVLTDRSQTGNLAQQCSVLAYMFETIESGLIKVHLNPNLETSENMTTAPTDENMNYVSETLSQLLIRAFPHLQLPQIKIFIKGLFSFDQNFADFKEHVRDFLVQIRQVTGEDLSDLYLDERNEEIQKAQLEKLQKQSLVPGLINPNEIDMLD